MSFKRLFDPVFRPTWPLDVHRREPGFIQRVLHSNLSEHIEPLSSSSARDRLKFEADQVLSTGFQGREVERISFRSPDGDLLDGVKLSTEISAHRTAQKIAILFCPGRGVSWESLGRSNDIVSDFTQFFQEMIPEADVFIVNPLGIGESRGTFSYESGLISFYGTMKTLKHIGYEALCVYGHSMGVWKSVESASLFYREHPEFRLCFVADRGFYDFAPVAASYLAGEGKVKGVVSTVLKWTGFSKDISSAAHSLGERLLVIHADNDDLIPEVYRLKKVAGEICLLNAGTGFEHLRGYNNQEAEKISTFMRKHLVL